MLHLALLLSRTYSHVALLVVVNRRSILSAHFESHLKSKKMR